MKFLKLLPVFILFLSVTIFSCKKETTGCLDPKSDNYNAEATVDDNSCTYQKRFSGDFQGTFDCEGLFKTIFTTADVNITELPVKSEVNIIITTTIGPLPVKGIIVHKDSIAVDATLPNLEITPEDIFAGAGTDKIKVTGRVITKLYVSNDNNKLSGPLVLKLILQEPLLIFPAGSEFTDNCAFEATRK